MTATATAQADEQPGAHEADGGCSGAESFALRVLGEDMAPEFNDGDIIIIEPDGALKDGCFVLAQVAGEYVFRQLQRRAPGPGWALVALNPACSSLQDVPLADDAALHAAVRGRVIQKAVPGRRRLSRFYV